MTFSLPFSTFCRPNSSLRIQFSSASCAHPSQDGLWWTEGIAMVKHHYQGC